MGVSFQEFSNLVDDLIRQWRNPQIAQQTRSAYRFTPILSFELPQSRKQKRPGHESARAGFYLSSTSP
ncbi:hypothetical protein MPL1032_20283 [Mesorhizobium plurifarium]|uniref:Uncharacterized protein n=1 Tax=Mesorhizobium plurifarium TaxID=69974 RepID=A0A0K2VWD5_MESPL|nr:hypothetical protein MPL1032_20283 [Mesorhizobium plurifarium]